MDRKCGGYHTGECSFGAAVGGAEGLRASQMGKKPWHICQGINSLVASGHALDVVSATWAAENTFSSNILLGSTMSFSSRLLSYVCSGMFFYFLTAFRECNPKPLFLSEMKSIITSLLSFLKKSTYADSC